VLRRRTLGDSGIDVSPLALGSWRTFERIPRAQGLAVMREARGRGITFLDDARYDDETGTAPLPTGYSEVVFGELFRGAGWMREQVVVANKLWWEFWPDESAGRELDGSLRRMRFDYLDLVYAAAPPEGLGVEEVVRSLAGLIAAGKLRAWGVLNWPPSLVLEAAEFARRGGLPGPCAAQLPYNLALRDPVESVEAAEALASSGVSVVASWVLGAGALTGRYSAPHAQGRLAGELDRPQLQAALRLVEPLRLLAERLGATPAALAIAFALANPAVASALFGASRPEQVAENAGALDVLEALGEAELAELRAFTA
jgi:L-glyceraldehyde 3-phosphate reductase